MWTDGIGQQQEEIIYNKKKYEINKHFMKSLYS